MLDARFGSGVNGINANRRINTSNDTHASTATAPGRRKLCRLEKHLGCFCHRCHGGHDPRLAWPSARADRQLVHFSVAQSRFDSGLHRRGRGELFRVHRLQAIRGQHLIRASAACIGAVCVSIPGQVRASAVDPESRWRAVAERQPGLGGLPIARTDTVRRPCHRGR